MDLRGTLRGKGVWEGGEWAKGKKREGRDTRPNKREKPT